MDIKSTLKVIDAADVAAGEGVIPEQRFKRLVGCPDVPTDRLRVGVASYTPGAIEALHWHPIEAFYFVLSGHATVRDYEGREYEVHAGCAIYAPPGIAGAHEWEVKEGLTLLAVRGTPESDRKLQFTVDKQTKRSYIDLDDLVKRGGVSFKSHY